MLKDICVWEANIVRSEERDMGARDFRFGERMQLIDTEDGKTTFHATYGVLEFSGDKEVMRLEVTIRAVYETPKEVSAEIFGEFLTVSLRVHTIPFAREWFRDASGRMGIEPILLPLAIAHPAAFKRNKASKDAKSTKSI